jgi:hypothetical protein
VFDAGKVPIFVAPTLTSNDTNYIMQKRNFDKRGLDGISCLSTVHAIANILQLKPDIPFEWLVVVDDDTFVNTVHLEKVLHRYNSSNPMFVVTDKLQPITYFTSLENGTTGIIHGGSTAAGLALSVGLMRRLRDERSFTPAAIRHYCTVTMGDDQAINYLVHNIGVSFTPIQELTYSNPTHGRRFNPNKHATFHLQLKNRIVDKSRNRLWDDYLEIWYRAKSVLQC